MKKPVKPRASRASSEPSMFTVPGKAGQTLSSTRDRAFEFELNVEPSDGCQVARSLLSRQDCDPFQGCHRSGRSGAGSLETEECSGAVEEVYG